MKAQKIVIFLSLLWLLIPFIFLNDLFPFFRFGMFAEPVRFKIQSEQFEIYYKNDQNKRILLQAKLIGLNEGHFAYVVRQYVYKQKSTQLLQNLHHIYGKNKNIHSWILTKIISNPSNQMQKNDTIPLAIFEIKD